MGSDEASLTTNRAFMSKLNLCFVQVFHLPAIFMTRHFLLFLISEYLLIIVNTTCRLSNMNGHIIGPISFLRLLPRVKQTKVCAKTTWTFWRVSGMRWHVDIPLISSPFISEEVFDFSSGTMTQAKIKELKQGFNKVNQFVWSSNVTTSSISFQEFSLIYELCEFILERAQRPSLILVTLETLLRFLNWIPVGYIFETKMIESLASKVFLALVTCNDTRS